MNSNFKEILNKYKSEISHICGSFLKWLAIALCAGIFIGIAGALFHICLDKAAQLRMEHDFLIFLLPVAGIVIVALYHLCKMDDDKGTNQIILGAQGIEGVSLKTAPLIFVATFLTHLFGGSAGREGAALQLGGSLISPLQRLLHLSERDYGILIMCGMAAGFSSLFGTPVAAAVFAMEVAIVERTQYSAIVPCLISSVTASVTARLIGCSPTAFTVNGIPTFSFDNIYSIFTVLLLGIGGAVAAVLFCRVLKAVKKLYVRYIPNIYLRAAVGGVIVIILTLIVGNRDYNGAGTEVIVRAFEGNAFWGAFLLKILFTALTLGAGFRGGEIVPTIFIGSTFGCFLGELLQIDPSFGAAVGTAAVFCGVTNCPLATIVICVEMFGGEGIVYYALAAGVSYMLSGNDSLYSSQRQPKAIDGEG